MILSTSMADLILIAIILQDYFDAAFLRPNRHRIPTEMRDDDDHFA